MIRHQHKSKKKEAADKFGGLNVKVTTIKKSTAANGNDMPIDDDLDQFSNIQYLPEKFKEDEKRLANSVLPDLLSSLK